MKTRIVLGEDTEEISIKRYSGGVSVVESGDSSVQTSVLRKRLDSEEKGRVTKEDLEAIIQKPELYNFKNEKLVRKGKKG